MQYTLSILVENHAGVLSKISGLFSRRGFNIDSLAVGVTNDPRVSRITIVANGDEYVVEQLEKQLNKVIPRADTYKGPLRAVKALGDHQDRRDNAG